MKIFLSIKYHADRTNRERIEAIVHAFAQCGFKTLCLARDVEQWGKFHFDDDELMRCTFAEIDASDLVLVDLTEKGVGVGIEAGYAHAKGIPIVVIAQRGADISATLRGIARTVIFYDDLGKIADVLKGIEDNVR